MGDQTLTAAQRRADMRHLCDEIGDRYIYLDQKTTSWASCAEHYAELAEVAHHRDDVIRLAEQVLAEIYDHHAGLRAHAEGSPLLVPTHADVWVDMVSGEPVITALRGDSPASASILNAGDTLVAVGGVSVEDILARDRSARVSGTRQQDEADAWTLRTALAGRRGESTRRVTVRQVGLDEPVTVELPSLLEAARQQGPWAQHARINKRLAWVRLGNTLGHKETIDAFDEALGHHFDADGLLLDLRGTPSGGSNGVAEPILGRFVDREMPYQRLRYLAGRSGSDHSGLSLACAIPRRDAPRFDKPVVVLVSRWTGSMGEGIAIGMETVAGALVVGTPMGRLGGAVEVYQMPHSGIRFQMPVRQIDHINGTPRERYVPAVLVDPRGPAPAATPSLDVEGLQAIGGPDVVAQAPTPDRIFVAAVRALESRLSW